jgi:hypothetical protein
MPPAEILGGRNSCFTLFQWKRNSGFHLNKEKRRRKPTRISEPSYRFPGNPEFPIGNFIGKSGFEKQLRVCLHIPPVLGKLGKLKNTKRDLLRRGGTKAKMTICTGEVIGGVRVSQKLPKPEMTICTRSVALTKLMRGRQGLNAFPSAALQLPVRAVAEGGHGG